MSYNTPFIIHFLLVDLSPSTFMYSPTQQADLDGDGKLDYTEFTQMMLWDLED